MTLVDKGFRVYSGRRTPSALRFLVLTRYAVLEIVKTRKAISVLVLSAVVPLLAATLIYLRHNVPALAMLPGDMGAFVRELAVDGTLFYHLLRWQAGACFFLFLISGGTLISEDLKDNALPLYLSRPIGRVEYVGGKLAVLAFLGSAVTWIPLGLLILLQTSLEGLGWLLEHPRIPLALFVGSWIVILVLGFVCLAMSALLRAKAAAEGAFLSVFLLTPLLAGVINETLDTDLGQLLNVRKLVEAVDRALFGLEPFPELGTIPATIALLVLVGVCVGFLARKVKAYEVVK
ncbi:MAG: hypothetical protein R3234_10440 [Thermoanaerobaculia bacterium]|nr:hypothetical protein [Thermoanaerobaculia bacterium]